LAKVRFNRNSLLIESVQSNCKSELKAQACANAGFDSYHCAVQFPPMNNIACQLEYSVNVKVSRPFAWKWRTDIQNWNDPPAQFQLDGPFAAGSWGTTLFPGQEPLRWQIRDVRPEEAFVIEMPLDGAVLAFEWFFKTVSTYRTRITQRIVLSGDNAKAYVNQVEAGFGSNLAEGMRRIADAMAEAERGQRVKSPDSVT